MWISKVLVLGNVEVYIFKAVACISFASIPVFTFTFCLRRKLSTM